MMVTSAKVKRYRKAVEALIDLEKLPRPPCYVLYRCYLKDRMRDAQNCQKTLIDALYKQDRRVYPWCLPEEVDKENPHVEVWIIPKKGE